MNLVDRRLPKTDGPKIYRSDNGGEFLAIGFRDACMAEDPTVTPFEKLWGRKPDLKFVKTFGQRCVAIIPPRDRSAKYKFRPKGQSGVFIGSDPQRKGFFVYVTGQRHEVVHSRSVIFLDPPTSDSVQTISDPHDDPLRIVDENDAAGDDDDSFDSDTITTNSKRHSSSSTRIAEYTGKPAPPNLRCSERIANLSTSVALSAAHVQLHEIIQEPVNLNAARALTEWHLWEKAIRDEIEALRANDTFDLVDPPPGAHIIGFTIVFRVKLSAHGDVERLKTRICARGFTQEFLKDNYETYAPVAKLTSIRVFLAIATQMGMRVRQGDVPTAYVKAGLTEVLYVQQPRGFEEGSRRRWNVELNKFLVDYGLIPTREDACVYIHPTNNLIMLIYVDDIPIGYKSDKSMMNLMQALQTKYGVKDLGNVQWFLGVWITMETTRGITTMDQTQYTSEVLRRLEMDECRPRKTPLDKGTILYNRAEDDDNADKVTSRQAVGALLYLARVTRPDIAFVVNQVSAHASNPSQGHWIAVKTILRYVKGTKEWGLVYRRNTSASPVQVYTDADWANNEHNRNPFPASSFKASYIAADDGVEEAHWVHLLLQRLTDEKHQVPIPAMIDNKSTIKRLLNGKNSDAQKTVYCRFFAIRDAVTTGHIVTPSGILSNPEKVKAVMNVERPQDLHGIRSFLGLTFYFRGYIPGYALISAPLERLKVKDAPFEWTEDRETAFRQLKRALVKPPILMYPDMTKRFKLYVDTSRYAVGACLMQVADGKDRVVAWAMELSNLDFKVHHKPGKSMCHVGGLLRLVHSHANAVTMTYLLNPDETPDVATDDLVGEQEEKDGLDIYSEQESQNEQELPEELADGGITSDQPIPYVDRFGLDAERFLPEQRKVSSIVAVVAFLGVELCP
ncbi:unnamed protein product [Phytophthora fragariaefolia]|uniref:Unnamed protein product n=1 Tax=Phytophthora fragariaefolia TaxID=1490495 RepID=A0A9W6X4H4_9STRA|nr:unnamed protein product [Phytophthora fragariaefolia]